MFGKECERLWSCRRVSLTSGAHILRERERFDSKEAVFEWRLGSSAAARPALHLSDEAPLKNSSFGQFFKNEKAHRVGGLWQVNARDGLCAMGTLSISAPVDGLVARPRRLNARYRFIILRLVFENG